MSSLLLTGIGQLVTNDPSATTLLGIRQDAAVAIEGGTVRWVGATDEVPAEFESLPELDCGGRAVIPGFVDSHTHAIFAGNRADEFQRRRAGESYEDILAAGGGIHSTVAATRAASSPSLASSTLFRLQRMLALGTTTVEVKTGYGLNLTDELRLLDIITTLAEAAPTDIVATLLAHVVPADSPSREGYVATIIEEMIPAAAGKAGYCDVFCDTGAFTVAESRRILEAGRAAGLGTRIHAEQLTRTGAAALAADLGCVSADHLDHATAADAALLAAAGTVAVLLPTVSLSLSTPPPPARMLWDSGVTVALATDCNPGTSNVENMQLVIAIAVLEAALTPAEALWAATRGGALSLELPNKGKVMPGADADLVLLDSDTHVDISYRPGTDHARLVIKAGEVVAGG